MLAILAAGVRYFQGPAVHRQGGLLEDRTTECFTRQAPDFADLVLHFGQGCVRGAASIPAVTPAVR